MKWLVMVYFGILVSGSGPCLEIYVYTYNLKVVQI